MPAACQASLSNINSWSLLKLMSIESLMPSNHLILCRPLLLPPSIFPSIRVFSDESALCISSVHFSSLAQLCSTLLQPMDCNMPGLPVLLQLLKSTQPMSIKLVMPSSHLILCHPLLLLPLILPSIRVFSNESTLSMRWPKYWSFSFGISPSNEHSGLTCFRMDWLDLLAVQGTLKSLLQHHSLKASILQCSASFFMV